MTAYEILSGLVGSEMCIRDRADAVIALSAKQAIRNSQQPGGNGFMQFQPGWFEVNSDEIPEAQGDEAKKFWAKEKSNLGFA